ncbi:MAG: CRISPR-associated protein Cas5e family [Ramlibacter sp.]|jgi:CRISPR system Cascade subunit CasD|uniref:type I-E CRISPR-associated protein Cas5/CasD n=1 Tax=Ramlibacter sp. TaxID=1917967 RepID=UPI00261D1C99|nr:type I-E CRISPR-associated protein Cas5/CasD [Ramlibacter sp.]MDB5751819.1 CRISPR-associated protein Cas5e family [Ramlibacter sp.]
MHYLVFQLQAPLSSWGESAVGEFRGTAEHPTQSAVVGLVGAALGLLRDDEAAHAALRDGYGVAVALLSGGSLLRDYHTAQVPPRAALKGRPQATRRHELAVPRTALSTILSTRDYRQNAGSLVAMQSRSGGTPPHTLADLASALRHPKFTLYLGRKTCAPGAPLWPQVIEAESAQAGFAAYAVLFEAARRAAADNRGRQPLEPLPRVSRIAFDDHIEAGVPHDLSTRRKDRLIRRKGWQFADRTEYIAIIPDDVCTEAGPCTSV